MKRISTVTRDGWFVGSEDDMHGHVKLSVFKTLEKPHPDGFRIIVKYRYGDHHKKEFKSCEEASAFALEHGYLQVYAPAWCLKHRRQHYWLGHRCGCWGEDCTYDDSQEYAQFPYAPKWWLEKMGGDPGITYEHWQRLNTDAFLERRRKEAL